MSLTKQSASTDSLENAVATLGRSVAIMVSALPDVALACSFLVAWVSPGWLGFQHIPHLFSVMLLEFIVVHSSVFMGQSLLSAESTRKRAFSILGFGLLYSMFAGSFSFATHSWWPIQAFWLLTLNKFLFVILRIVPSDEQKWTWQSNWSLHVLFYLMGAFATTLLPLPRLGITPQAMRLIHLPGHGLWIEQPWRVLAFGFFYFTAVSITEILGIRMPKSSLPKSA